MKRTLQILLSVACAAVFVAGTAVAQDRAPESQPTAEAEADEREGSGDDVQERANPTPSGPNEANEEDLSGEGSSPERGNGE